MISTIHAREMTVPEQAMFFLEELIDGYGTDPDITWFIDWHDIYIIPVTNPDGRFIVEVVPPSAGSPDFPNRQRKNANNTACPDDSWGGLFHPGIDLNRNHSFLWNYDQKEPYGCSQFYPGTAPATEPEISYLEPFITSVIPDQRGTAITDPAPDNTMGIFLTLHTFGEVIVFPWGHTKTQAPNHDSLQRIGDKLEAMTGYTACQKSSCLSMNSGTSDEWAYGTLGIPSFVYEIGTWHQATYTETTTTLREEVGDSFLYTARIARTPYMLAEGPSVLDLTTTVNPSNTLHIETTINDSDNGGQVVDTAVYHINTPYWATNAVTNTLQIQPLGVYTFTADVNLCSLGLPAGQHTLWVRGKDTDGNWGPAYADWFTADPTDCPPSNIQNTTLSARPPHQSRMLLITILLITITTTLIFVTRRHP